MALDWNRNISFAGLMKKDKDEKKFVLPSKTSINLAKSDKKPIDVRKAVIIGVAAFIVAVLFAKFAVIDFYGRVADKQAELRVEQDTLASLNAGLKDYDAVAEEYGMYSALSVSDGTSTPPARAVIGLVESNVSPKTSLASIRYEGDVLVLVLNGMTLEEVGDLTAELNGNEMVKGVSVSNATTEASSPDGLLTTMSIELDTGAAAR